MIAITGSFAMPAIRRVRQCALICLLGFVPVDVPAHHSYAAEFDADSPATIEGVVKEVWFKSPHVRYYITVTDSTLR